MKYWKCTYRVKEGGAVVTLDAVPANDLTTAEEIGRKQVADLLAPNATPIQQNVTLVEREWLIALQAAPFQRVEIRMKIRASDLPKARENAHGWLEEIWQNMRPGDFLYVDGGVVV